MYRTDDHRSAGLRNYMAEVYAPDKVLRQIDTLV